MATITLRRSTRPRRATGRASRHPARARDLVRDRGAAAGAGRRRPVRLRPVPLARRSPTSSPAKVPPPTPVAAAPAEVGPMPRYLDGIGTLTAVREVDGLARGRGPGDRDRVRPPAPSVAGRAHPLVQLNDAPEQADLASYQAQRAAGDRQSRAHPAAGAARLRHPGHGRPEPEALEEARAGIARSQAVIDQKLIKAPFDGELGLRQVELGQYVEPGRHAGDADRPRPALRQLHPARAGPRLGRGRAAGRAARRRLSRPRCSRRSSPTIEPQIDPTTRVMRLQATLANPDRRLLPGMFANARVVLPPRARRGERAGDRGRPHALRRFGLRRARGRQGRGRQAHAQGGADLRARPATCSTAGWRSCAASAPATLVVELGPAQAAERRAGARGRGRGPAAPGDAAGAVQGGRRPMRFTDLFVRRPVLAAVVSLLILLIGLRAFFELPVRQYPELKNTVITVTTSYPGRLGRADAGLHHHADRPGGGDGRGHRLHDLVLAQGASTVTAYVRLNYDPNVAMTDVMAKVQAGQVPDPAARPTTRSSSKIDRRHARP